MSRMIEIIINGQLVAIVIEDLAKLFLNTLVKELPVEVSIVTRVYRSAEQEMMEQGIPQPVSEVE